MNRLKSSVLTLAVLLALPAAVLAQIDDQPVQRNTEASRAELDALIAQQQYARAEQMVNQREASRDDPAATYFQIGTVYFDHDDCQRSAPFVERSLTCRGMNDEA